MTEHRIRLRAGWEVEAPDGTSRVNLPAQWPPGLDGPIRLIRRFGRPRPQETGESFQLDLVRVPGLVRLRINGRELELDERQGGGIRVELPDPLVDRNTLELEVHPARFPVERDPEGWGEIALIIVSEEADPA